MGAPMTPALTFLEALQRTDWVWWTGLGILIGMTALALVLGAILTRWAREMRRE